MTDTNYETLVVYLYPTSGKQKIMDKSIEVSGYVYNAFITVGKYYRNNYNKFPSKNDLRRLVTKFWNNCPWMQEIPNNCLFECADNAIRALKTCYDNYKKKKGNMFPGFKKRKDFSGFGFLSISNFKIYDIVDEMGKTKRYMDLRKIGTVVAKNLQKFPPGLPKTCHIKRKNVGGHYEYQASISFDVGSEFEKDEINLDNPHREPVGLDVGIQNIATLSNGTRYINKKFHQESMKTFSKLHRQLSSCVEHSEKYNKILAKIQHQYIKLENKRSNEIYKISKEVVFSNDQIYAEDISVKELLYHALSHKMTDWYLDACLGKFQKRLEVLTKEANRPIIYVDPAYTSQMCSRCGTIIKKSLEERVHECPYCGFTAHRDVNAAINILKKGLTCNPSVKSKMHHESEAHGSNPCLDSKNSNNIPKTNYGLACNPSVKSKMHHESEAHGSNAGLDNLETNYFSKTTDVLIINRSNSVKILHSQYNSNINHKSNG